ncbi:hypothetical protein DV515_00007243 [Chloebia gouldiae]|uniref:Uncharacterized protein n=1 Tax=Chloebia gouldiae TaxID=44316 RepID=A0A3L8SIL7_CHLGU|nr:hypothetical protein DV515_00007243 [Chloebia gouldiae]
MQLMALSSRKASQELFNRECPRAPIYRGDQKTATKPQDPVVPGAVVHQLDCSIHRTEIPTGRAFR